MATPQLIIPSPWKEKESTLVGTYLTKHEEDMYMMVGRKGAASKDDELVLEVWKSGVAGGIKTGSLGKLRPE